LPTYPFERKRYWIDEEKPRYAAPPQAHLEGEFSEADILVEVKSVQETEIRYDDGTPTNSMQKEVAHIWKELLGVEKISIHDNFFNLGGDSLIAIRLFSQIESTFGKRLPLAILFKAPTIGQLADLLVETQLKPSWGSLVGIQTKGTRIPFFCVHSEGGNVLEYQKLSEYLGREYPFYGLQAQGLEGKKAEKISVEKMAYHYIREIKNLQPAGPYYIGGYCLGGLVAFEMARQLEHEGEKIGLLAMISSSTPEHVRTSANYITIYRRWFYRYLERAGLELSNLSVLEGKKKMSYLDDRIRRTWLILMLKAEDFHGRIYSKLKSKPFKHSRPYLLEKMSAYQNEAFFEYKPLPIKTPIVLFRPSNTPRCLLKDPTLGWNHLSRGGIQDFEIKAFHKNILKDPQVRALAATLQKCIDLAQHGGESCQAISLQL
jgi:aspartate racemase